MDWNWSPGRVSLAIWMSNDPKRLADLEHEIARLRVELEEARQSETALRDAYDAQTSELETSRVLSQAVVEFAGVAIAVSDVKGAWIQSNTCFQQILGYSLDELRQRSNLEITHPSDRDKSRTMLLDLLEGRVQSFRLEKRYQHRDGHYVWVDLSVTPIRNELDDIVALVGAGIDITRRKEAEDELAFEFEVQSAMAQLGRTLLDPALTRDEIANLVREQARALTNSEHVLVSLISPDSGDVTDYPQPPVEDAVRDGLDLSPPGGDDDRYRDLWKLALRTGEAFFTEHPDSYIEPGEPGSDRGWIERFLAVPVVADGVVLGQIALANAPVRYTGRDVEAVERLANLIGLALQRERESMQRQHLTLQLRHSQKMEAIGLLTSGIAHDFNNQLTAISALSEMTLRKLPDGHPGRTTVQQIVATTERGRDLTRKLLAFGHKQALELQSVDLNGLTEGFVVMLRRTLREDIEIQLRLAPDAPWIRCDPSQVEQILANLSLNAQDAMPDGGVLSISVGTIEMTEDDLKEHPEARFGPHALLTVSDTGHGMSAETAARVFEPFFTTKKPGKGTGLGLPTVWGIVRQHGGHVRLETRVGGGATFSVYLPRIEDSARPLFTSTVERGPTPRGTETILVVEDDRLVRKSICRMLSILGYTVLEAEGGEQAIALATEHGGRIDVLLTDVIMPEMNGKDLSDQLTAAHTHVKTLFMSGYADEVLARYGILEQQLNYIHKPFTVEDIAGKLREVITG
jgi:PAS domain S-box-containing protein